MYFWQASIRFFKKHYCGGSIITSQHILTAAHCCFNAAGFLLEVRYLTVVVGDLNLHNPVASTVSERVAAVTYHGDYNPPELHDDIAVMKVQRIIFNKTLSKW